MHPNHKLSLSLLAGLVLWLPSLQAVIGGELDLLGAAIRLVLALTGARIAVGGLTHLWSSYAPDPDLDGDAGDDPLIGDPRATALD